MGVFSSILIETLSGLVKNLFWFILIIWAVKTIVKQMPKWLIVVFKEMEKFRLLDETLRRKK